MDEMMPLTWVDEKGRVKLPGRLRHKLGIEIGEEIIVELGQDRSEVKAR